MMKTRTVRLQKFKIVIPKVPLNTISFVKQDLTHAYLEATHRLVHFHFGGIEFPTDDQENTKLILYRSMQVRGNT